MFSFDIFFVVYLGQLNMLLNLVIWDAATMLMWHQRCMNEKKKKKKKNQIWEARYLIHLEIIYSQSWVIMAVADGLAPT